MNNKSVHKPVPFRKGCRVLRQYDEPYEAKGGFTGTATYVDFLDKKGKLNERYFLRIKWSL